MAYKALYRTYRPKDFEEIAGQEHITRTFKNALKNNKIAHAYLFSGPRGTGKTSIAKIIAKAVNCEKAPVANPCNECDTCLGIENNTISDVIEIDAASNNGVDEIREIRDKVKYLPGVGKYKVYIIDEVHMLSTGAFNALLKTLEEPPKHVIFILATTEPHKIPATIHSRCQRFDFRGVSVPEMIKRMNKIIKEEFIEIEPEAVKVIAESAEGGMRDAISLLDQVVSYTETKVTVEDVHAIKGTVSNEKLLEIARAIYNNNSVQAIKLLDELVALGKEAQRLVDNLIQFYRDVLVYKNTNTDNDQLLFLNVDFIELSKKLSNNLIFYYIDVLNKAKNDMKWTNNAKLYMEIALIKMVDIVEKQEIVIEDTFGKLTNEIAELKKSIKELKERKVVVEVPVKVEEPVMEDLEEEELQEEYLEDNEVEVDEKEPKEQEDNVDEYQEELDRFYGEQTEDKEEEDTEQPTDLFSMPEVTEEKEEKVEEPYKTFDIRIVEEVLNNGDREAKIKLNQRWFDIERNVSPNDMQYVNLITSGRVVATNGKMMIIQYPSPSTCNRLMMPEIKEKVIELLSAFHGIECDYLALPTEVWEQKMNEFMTKWRQDKVSFIQLSPIEHPGLKELAIEKNDKDEFTPDSVKEAMSLFGSDNIRVKKGE
jgi:DNA polymerase-3 subunit gamma/tau